MPIVKPEVPIPFLNHPIVGSGRLGKPILAVHLVDPPASVDLFPSVEAGIPFEVVECPKASWGDGP
jgi:hypothetical protein